MVCRTAGSVGFFTCIKLARIMRLQIVNMRKIPEVRLLWYFINWNDGRMKQCWTFLSRFCHTSSSIFAC